MEAIKKKMQSMKVEKDNLMDRCDNCEQVIPNPQKSRPTISSFPNLVGKSLFPGNLT